MSKAKASKNAYRRQQKKLKQQETQHAAEATPVSEPTVQGSPPDAANEVVARDEDTPLPTTEQLDLSGLAAEYEAVFKRFQENSDEAGSAPEQKEEVIWEDDDIPEEEDETKPKKSKKQRKRENKLSVAELKAMAERPELVEWADADSSDPRLLLAIKSHRNIVPVAPHWSSKREYLASKRGIEKPPFRLPKFIADTGIAEMRDAALEKQAEQTLKQKMRERVQPKMGRLDIDYTKLYNAFFRFQTKPELTRYGEVYYEGKEFETNLKHLRPGDLSEDLKEALNIPPGGPPPWLLNMQRFGPPPSYPALRIPGVNAPIPPGASWGFHMGQWGKAPVDDQNKPLYGGDLFGVNQLRQADREGEPVDKSLWGELLPLEEESEEEEEDDDDEDEEEEEDDGAISPSGMQTGMHTGLPSDIGGMESVAGDFNLRKQRAGMETEEYSGPRQAYQVLQEHATHISGFMGSDRRYDIKGAQQQANIPMLGSNDSRKRKAGDVDVSVDLDELQREGKLSKDAINRLHEQQRQDPTKAWTVDQDDLSQMIAEESNKRQKQDREKREERKVGRR